MKIAIFNSKLDQIFSHKTSINKSDGAMLVWVWICS